MTCKVSERLLAVTVAARSKSGGNEEIEVAGGWGWSSAVDDT